jgi:DNA-binding HxlR family transcriptional regulator
VLYLLLDGRKRHGELRAHAAGEVSPKTLTDRLRELEQEGFVTREQFAEIPPRVEYELTDRGRSFGVVFDAMAQWGCADQAAEAAGRHSRDIGVSGDSAVSAG